MTNLYLPEALSPGDNLRQKFADTVSDVNSLAGGVEWLIGILEKQEKVIKDLRWRLEDIREDLLGGGRPESIYGIDEWSTPAINLRLAITLIDDQLNAARGYVSVPVSEQS